MIWGTIQGILARFFANIFKDWRRDQELVEKGRIEQRLDNLDESEVRRKDAEQIRREAESGATIVGDDEL